MRYYFEKLLRANFRCGRMRSFLVSHGPGRLVHRTVKQKENTY